MSSPMYFQILSAYPRDKSLADEHEQLTRLDAELTRQRHRGRSAPSPTCRRREWSIVVAWTRQSTCTGSRWEPAGTSFG
jgi:hypothetical protein